LAACSVVAPTILPPQALIHEGVDRAVGGHIEAAVGSQNSLEWLDRSAAAGDRGKELVVGATEPVKLAVPSSANDPDDWIRSSRRVVGIDLSV
jgi:hypothetical protein